MSDAKELAAKIRLQIKELEQKILAHPYLTAVEEGRIPFDQLQLFVGQQFHIISSDLRSISLLVSRYGNSPSRSFLMNVLHGEVAALEALHTFAAELKLSPADLEAVEPIPAAHAYCAYMAWIALYGSDAELAGALLVNFPAWGTNCRRMRLALRHKYNLAESALTFLALFADMPPFEAEALSVIQSGLDRGVSARSIHRAARMLQAYELMYWDALADAAGK